MSAQEVEATVGLEVLDASGKPVGTKEVPSFVVGSEVPVSLLHQVVRWQRAKKRAGTHSVKTRSEVAGGGAKPWRQKGTGRARAGSNSSPIWVGGGVAHGPKQRSYDFDINRKERRKALVGAVSVRNATGNLKVVKDLGLSEVKTREAAKVLAGLGVQRGSSALLVVDEKDENVIKSVRNLPFVKPITPNGLNVYDILGKQNLVFTENALEAFLSRVAPSTASE